MRTAKDLKIGETFKRNGITFKVASIENDVQKNGTKCLSISCFANEGIKADSFFSFKLDTKIK